MTKVDTAQYNWVYDLDAYANLAYTILGLQILATDGTWQDATGIVIAPTTRQKTLQYDDTLTYAANCQWRIANPVMGFDVNPNWLYPQTGNTL